MWRYADLVLGSVAISLLYYGLLKWRKRSNLPLPPGPKGAPLVGNLFQIPREEGWKKYHEWCKEYNTDLLYLNLAGTDFVVLDTSKAATDLLENRSSLYSGRAYMPMVEELMGWDFNFGIMTYVHAIRRKHRQVAHHSLHPVAIKEYWPQMIRSTRTFLKRLLDDPDPLNIILHLRHLAGETILSIAYGIPIQEENDPYLEISRESGKATASVVSTCLQKVTVGKEDDAFTEEVIQNVAGTLFATGSDSTVSVIASCILGLLEHPEVLKKAQAQVDSVVDPGHLPEFEHESSLPYITAIIYETLRWRDVAPIAVPHLLSTDDEYEGYRFPAGTVIIPNAWQVFQAMLHDETVYPDPFNFNPDRFINAETGQVDFARERDPSHACWGFGRRVCPGRHMALSAIWLAVASLVSVFDIEKAKEKVRVVEDGIEREEERTVELTHEYISDLIL
ncbi:hypothetical protein H1R20_g8642, partial [Candolleomyces eurysporus]